MKNLILFTATVFITAIGPIVKGQGRQPASGGIYMTSDDFEQQKLTYTIDCNDAANKIKTNEFFGSSTGYVVSKGERHEFSKDSVYGYRNCENKNFRFYHGEAYLLIDTAGFYIYYQYRSEENVKGKGLIKKDEYFFSKNAIGDLQLLTIAHLKESYRDNHVFHYALDAYFKSDKDLLGYDQFLKELKVKHLFKQSLL